MLRAALAPLLFVSAALLVATAAAPVAAQDVPRLKGPVTDRTGVLAGREAEIGTAIDRVRDADGVELWVLFVPTNEGRTAADFASEVFRTNSLGGNDTLFVVALDERTDIVWVSDALQITDAEITGITSDVAEPRLRDGDYAGAAIAVAEALGEANRATSGDGSGGTSGGGGVPGGGGLPGGQTGGTGSSGPDLGGLLGILGGFLGVVLVLLGIGFVVAATRQWQLDRRTAEERDRRTGQLAREANALLIQTDDAIRDAGQELGFVEAQFGEADVAPFRDAIARSQAELKASFAVRQRLDDAVPEDPATREQMLGEIVERSKRALAILDEQRRRVEELRAFEQRAPEVLEALPAAIDALEARLPGAEAAFGRLSSYAPATWQPVKGNLEEARKRIAYARAEVARGATTLSTDRPAAARSARAAQDALAQATGLLDAVERLADSLDEARKRLDAELVAAATDVERARAALEAAAAEPIARQKVGEAGQLLAAANAAAASATPDVLAALKAAQQANALADETLEGIREAEERRTREAAALAAALRSAELSVARVADFIDSRRSGVGREARTRLAEAERHLDEARGRQATDASAALAEARTAERLADEAYRLASDDFDDYDLRGRGRRGGDDLTGVVLGGIILGNILGGIGRGGHGGGWGGTPWGSPGGHGGGGVFGGGGGHGGGGRW